MLIKTASEWGRLDLVICGVSCSQIFLTDSKSGVSCKY